MEVLRCRRRPQNLKINIIFFLWLQNLKIIYRDKKITINRINIYIYILFEKGGLLNITQSLHQNE